MRHVQIDRYKGSCLCVSPWIAIQPVLIVDAKEDSYTQLVGDKSRHYIN